MEDRVTQRWWNGHWGMASERLRIHVHTLDDESQHWSVRRTSGEKDDQSLAYPCDTERHAGETVEQLRAEIGGTWTRVDNEALGYRG